MFDTSILEDLTLGQIFTLFYTHCLNYTRNARACAAISDSDFIHYGLQRILAKHRSGREYLQSKSDDENVDIARSTFFDSLQSPRRLAFMSDISEAFTQLLNSYFEKYQVDYLKDFPELAPYQIFSGDGHFIEHAVHTDKDSSGKNYGAGTLYIQNIRTGLLSVLDVVTDGTRKSHEMPIFRNSIDSCLPSEKKTLWILDRAYVDKSWWPKKKKDGQHVIVRVKKKTVLIDVDDIYFDPKKQINTGVTRFYRARMGKNSSPQRIIEYTDPESLQRYQFVCSVTHIEPGLVAWLYLLRWRIEKAFDNLKNDFNETRAWATGKNALEIQSQLICMNYNFSRFIVEFLKNESYYSGIIKLFFLL